MNVLKIMSDRIQRRQAFRRLFQSPDGEVVLRTLVKEGFVSSTTFVAGDTHQTALNEGSRRMVLSILKYANVDPKQMIESELKDA